MASADAALAPSVVAGALAAGPLDSVREAAATGAASAIARECEKLEADPSCDDLALPLRANVLCLQFLAYIELNDMCVRACARGRGARRAPPRHARLRRANARLLWRRTAPDVRERAKDVALLGVAVATVASGALGRFFADMAAFAWPGQLRAAAQRAVTAVRTRSAALLARAYVSMPVSLALEQLGVASAAEACAALGPDWAPAGALLARAAAPSPSTASPAASASVAAATPLDAWASLARAADAASAGAAHAAAAALAAAAPQRASARPVHGRSDR
jgi:hypothetical protein